MPCASGAAILDVQALAPLLPQTAAIDEEEVCIGGCSLRALAEEFGTPLYVYDEETLRCTAEEILRAFQRVDARVSFAAKACSLLGVLRIVEDVGLGLDVVSLGELEAGLLAGFAPERIHMHGNCKSKAELEAAVHGDIHAIVMDNREELSTLEGVCEETRHTARVMLRLALPLEAETHPSLMTAGRYSKFGFSPDEEDGVWETMQRSERLRLIGIHVHLGSQIADLEIYRRATDELVGRMDALRRRGLPVEEVSIGGGWAVPYRSGDPLLKPEDVAATVGECLRGRTGVRLAVEPGRSVVARSAVAIYRVGSVKRSEVGRIVAVDGGMGDNPRPALYGSAYTALPVNGATREADGQADVVGRYCESGDVLARNVPLPRVSAGDLLFMPVAGAYQLSMVSEYNRVPAPAVVIVSNGAARVISRRATVADLFARESA